MPSAWILSTLVPRSFKCPFNSCNSVLLVGARALVLALSPQPTRLCVAVVFKCKLLQVTGQKQQSSKTTEMDVKALQLRHRCDVCDRSFDTQQGLRIHKTRWCTGREGPIRSRKGTWADKLVRRDKRKAIEENRDDKLFLKDGSQVKGTFANAYLDCGGYIR